jgi:hypothetical protein
MNLFTELKNHLDSDFKELKLLQPLFFKDAPGLRFDLQDASLETGESAYFEEVVKRMDKIHAATTSESDIMILLYQKYCYKRSKIRLRNYLFKQLKKDTAIIQFRRNKRLLTEQNGDLTTPSDGFCQVVIKDVAANINFHNLFVATSHMDFGIKPLIYPRDGELYIVNLTSKTVTLMYDDRGCDLISYDLDVLKSYYNKLSDLILEVNRSQIIEQLQISK